MWLVSHVQIDVHEMFEETSPYCVPATVYFVAQTIAGLIPALGELRPSEGASPLLVLKCSWWGARGL